ncbi:hypothetical protein L9F63_015208 [Diploptera punctata]|uniref:PHLPP-like RA domain-containing protein n=1 Tax=Diploptera punctata TaxID=6984 RepID=A0AAD8EKU6_DIPPU|nr:hypothetical protein L9F63_015208 [Diploptera punctata]
MGWIRVYTGQHQDTLISLQHDTSVRDVCRDLSLPRDLSLWIQYGGGTSQRLSPQDKPLELQDEFLKKLGYTTAARRARLGIDPELRHLLRFHTGPREPQSGVVNVLKGLVFPQWRSRTLAVLQSKLFLYPGASSSEPEILDLSGGEVSQKPPRAGLLVLRVAPALRDTTRYVFLGFSETWERDLWQKWLCQSVNCLCTAKKKAVHMYCVKRIEDHSVEEENTDCSYE